MTVLDADSCGVPSRSRLRSKRRPPVPDKTPAVVPLDTSWTAFALCGGQSELFFEPPNERPGARARREKAAKEVCGSCPVRLACLDAGRRNYENGIWGGETEEERALAGFPPRSISRRSVEEARQLAISGRI